MVPPRKEQNTQGQERVNCLKIYKRRNWVRYLTDPKDITMTDTYNSESLIRIKTENMDIINGKIHQDVEASIMSMVINPNEELMEHKKPTIYHKELEHIWNRNIYRTRDEST